MGGKWGERGKNKQQNNQLEIKGGQAPRSQTSHRGRPTGQRCEDIAGRSGRDTPEPHNEGIYHRPQCPWRPTCPWGARRCGATGTWRRKWRSLWQIWTSDVYIYVDTRYGIGCITFETLWHMYSSLCQNWKTSVRYEVVCVRFANFCTIWTSLFQIWKTPVRMEKLVRAWKDSVTYGAAYASLSEQRTCPEWIRESSVRMALVRYEWVSVRYGEDCVIINRSLPDLEQPESNVNQHFSDTGRIDMPRMSRLHHSTILLYIWDSLCYCMCGTLCTVYSGQPAPNTERSVSDVRYMVQPKPSMEQSISYTGQRSLSMKQHNPSRFYV